MRAKTILPEGKENDAKAQPQRTAAPMTQQYDSRDLSELVPRLQRTHGNRYVQRLLRSGLIQAKLTVSEPGDRFEQEADRVAAQVMRMTDQEAAETATGSQEIPAPQIQRMCSQCEKEIHRQPLEEEEEEVRTRRTNALAASPMVQRVCGECEEELHRQQDGQETAEPSDEAEPLVNEVVHSAGHSLGSAARDFFEPRFGRDFSSVQVHTDEAAAESARAVSARAYTLGHHIVFGEGEYNPATDAGRRLLAHELVHVVQQSPHTVARKPVLSLRRSDSESPKTINNRPAAVTANAEVQLKADERRLSVNRLQPAIQRDFALEPPHPERNGRVLTPQQMADAIAFNNRVIGNAGADIIREIRDVIGTSPEPAVVDADFVNAVVSWQAVQGLTQDGQLGPRSAAPLFREIGAEGVGECKLTSGPTYSPSGTIPPTITGGLESAFFRLSADFESNPATQAFPSCCEVRQFIRWNAASVAALPNNVPHPGFPAGSAADTWIEDRGGTNDRYGHRSGPHAQPDGSNQFLDSTGARNQAFGERYRGTDNPGDDPANAATIMAGTWRFLLRVVDVCNGGVKVGSDDFIRINW